MVAETSKRDPRFDEIRLLSSRVKQLEETLRSHEAIPHRRLQWVYGSLWSSGIPPWTAAGAPHNVGILTMPLPGELVTWSFNFYVDTTNDGSNEWTIRLTSHDGSSFLNIDEIQTGTYAADTWHEVTRSGGDLTNTDMDTIHWLYTRGLVNAGTPGDLWVVPSAVRVKR